MTLHRSLGSISNFTAGPDKPFVQLNLTAGDLEKLLNTPGLVSIQKSENHNWRREFVQLWVRVMAATMSSGRPLEEVSEVEAPRIVSGTTASPGVHPFQVAFLHKTIADNFYAQFCGSTLIADRYVVTAAHRSDTIISPVDNVEVLVGTQALNGTGQRINVSTVINQPSWSPNTFNYDVSVWQLATPVTGSVRQSGGTQPTTPRRLLRVTGWDTLSYQYWFFPTQLQQVDVLYFPTSFGRCQRQGHHATDDLRWRGRER